MSRNRRLHFGEKKLIIVIQEKHEPSVGSKYCDGTLTEINVSRDAAIEKWATKKAKHQQDKSFTTADSTLLIQGDSTEKIVENAIGVGEYILAKSTSIPLYPCQKDYAQALDREFEHMQSLPPQDLPPNVA